MRELCAAAAAAASSLGYEPILLTDQLSCQAREAGVFLADIVRTHRSPARPLAYLAGGETVVKVIGDGRGGRNQELALAAAAGIAGLDAAVFSVGTARRMPPAAMRTVTRWRRCVLQGWTPFRF